MRPMRGILIVAAVLAVLAATVLVGGGASADESKTAMVHKLALTVQDGARTNVKVLTARMWDETHELGNKTVDFYVTADFFGQREMKIGSVITDVTGTAVMNYEPKWTGAHIITARCQELPGFQAVQTFQFSGVTPQYVKPPLGMELVRQWSPKLLPVVFGIVWVLMLFIGFVTLRGIAQSSHDRREIALEMNKTRAAEKAAISMQPQD